MLAMSPQSVVTVTSDKPAGTCGETWISTHKVNALNTAQSHRLAFLVGHAACHRFCIVHDAHILAHRFVRSLAHRPNCHDYLFYNRTIIVAVAVAAAAKLATIPFSSCCRISLSAYLSAPLTTCTFISTNRVPCEPALPYSLSQCITAL